MENGSLLTRGALKAFDLRRSQHVQKSILQPLFILQDAVDLLLNFGRLNVQE
jgi:hypothetical protein